MSINGNNTQTVPMTTPPTKHQWQHRKVNPPDNTSHWESAATTPRKAPWQWHPLCINSKPPSKSIWHQWQHQENPVTPPTDHQRQHPANPHDTTTHWVSVATPCKSTWQCYPRSINGNNTQQIHMPPTEHQWQQNPANPHATTHWVSMATPSKSQWRHHPLSINGINTQQVPMTMPPIEHQWQQHPANTHDNATHWVSMDTTQSKSQ